jgi:hypothetical protein
MQPSAGIGIIKIFTVCPAKENMGYYVRLLTASEEVVPFAEIEKQGKFIRLVSGTDNSWEGLEIFEPENNLIATLNRLVVSPGSPGEKELARVKDLIRGCYPENAREWVRSYLSRIRVIYNFQLIGDSVTTKGWPVLGRMQNLLKDRLSGIIQADQEGFYNENGDYILWQMYEGAAGSIPAATLNETGEWISYQLRLDPRSIDRFKQGILPAKGLLDRLLGR